MRIFHRAAIALFLAVSPLSAEVRVEDIIERARATLGASSALDAVVTLRIVGSLQPVDPGIPPASLLIIARKPHSQRMEIQVDDIVETTILNGDQGCMIRSNLNADASRMRDLADPELERVLYSTRQFFNFYRPDYKNGETVRFVGIETRQKTRSYSLRYSYPGGLETTRYFSVEDASLVSTVTENGVESVGIGSQLVGGIQFPKQIDYFERGRKLHTIVLEEIQVNKPLTAGIFDIPEGD